MNNPFFSVIVPVYKAEKYLHQCIDSIVNQSFEDFELILVDDGSPDRCGVICDEYAAKDSRIRVIHKPNGGVSTARNTALRVATGEYILFCDSDDYYLEGAFREIHAHLQSSSCDILHYGLIRELAENGERIMLPLMNAGKARLTNDELIKMAFAWHGHSINTHLLVFCQVIRRKLITDNGILFDETMARGEDNTFLLQVNALADSIVKIPLVGYFYRFTPGSLINTRAVNAREIKTSIHFLHNMVDVLEKRQAEPGKYMHFYIKSLVRVAMHPCAAHIKHEKRSFGVRRAYIKQILDWFHEGLREEGLSLDGAVGMKNMLEACLLAHNWIFAIDLYTRLIVLYERIKGY